MQRIIEFQIAQKDILNSNSMPTHFIVKGKMVSNLREQAAEVGMLHHPEETQKVVEEKLRWLKVAAERQMKRTRLSKRLKKSGMAEDAIALELDESFPEEEKPVFEIEPLFSKFTVRLDVFSPTRRRVDPPNLWPSLKALGDGLTDAGLWIDDSFEYMLETSFRYGGLSGIKGVWRLRMTITEVSDISDFVTEAELH